jgi:hypothetical protein
MADEAKPRFMRNVMQRVAGQADAVKAGAAMAFKEKASDIREAIGPEKLEPVKEPERPFGNDEGGQDVSRVVWTGHTVQTPEGRAYFGAAGLTESGYYRAADVQVYGADELWRWREERHIDKAEAIASAESLSANRLRGEDVRPANEGEHARREVLGKEQTNMAEIPEHLKAKASAEMANVREATAALPPEAKAANEPQPSVEAAIAQEKIAQMAKSGHDADAIHNAATKDDFTRQ